MPAFETAIDIAASRAIVWGLLTDAPAYPEWNPAVVRINGEIAPGHRISVVSTANPSRGFHVTVTDFEPENRMVWRGGLPLGLFTGTRTFLLGDSRKGVRFEMSESYSGPLAVIATRTIPDQQESFDAFAAGLRDAAQAVARRR